MFLQPMLPGFDDATSSPALQDGNSPSNSPDGPTNGPSGRVVARANRSRQPASGRGSKTNGTCGPSSSGSSTPSDRLASSVSRLLAEAGLNGGMEYRQTWKRQATPAGRSIWAHIASGRRTSGSDCSGWPTPVANEFECKDPGKTLARRKECKERTGTGNGFGLTLGQIVHTTGPNQAGGALPADAAMAGWATPMAATPGAGNCDYSRSVEAAMGLRPGKNEPLTGWPATTKTDAERHPSPGGFTTKNITLNHAVLGATTASSPASTERRGVLDAAFSRWLMGFPENWDRSSPGWESWELIQKTLSE